MEKNFEEQQKQKNNIQIFLLSQKDYSILEEEKLGVLFHLVIFLLVIMLLLFRQCLKVKIGGNSIIQIEIRDLFTLTKIQV